MCLYIGINTKAEVATEDIICYKFLRTMKANGSDCLLTPYRMTFIHIGETYTSRLIVTGIYTNEYTNEEQYVINVGIHSFKEYNDADDAIADVYGLSDEPRIIAKCIIPKGAEYYTGTFNGRESYASDELTYLEIINLG
jgi:hypothetical protein